MTRRIQYEREAAPQRGAERIWHGMLVMVVVGFGLVSVAVPDGVSFWARLGLALFLGFWSGPFFGTAAAVSAYGLAQTHRRAVGRETTSDSVDVGGNPLAPVG